MLQCRTATFHFQTNDVSGRYGGFPRVGSPCKFVQRDQPINKKLQVEDFESDTINHFSVLANTY